MRNTIAIVGGGFCGTVLAANLLRRPPSDATDIVLIERGPTIGRGVAYAAREFPYLIECAGGAACRPIPRMHLQFLHFARRRIPDADGEDFLPRALYGDYLQDLLLRAERDAPAHVRLLRIAGEVRRVVPRGGDGCVHCAEFADRPPIAADRVILALGNPPPALLPWAAAIRDHAAYRHDPWELPKTLSAKHSVLIVGNGLTMADAASALTEDAARAPALHTISRHGVVPLPQTAFRPSALRGDGEALLALRGFAAQGAGHDPPNWRARSKIGAATGAKWSPSYATWRRRCGGACRRPRRRASCGTCRYTGAATGTACRRSWPSVSRTCGAADSSR